MKRVKNILSSTYFLLVCLILIVIGFFAPAILDFQSDVDNQNATLFAILETQNEVISLRQTVSQLNSTIQELQTKNDLLVRIVCSQQKQLVSLGAQPAEELSDCSEQQHQ